MVNDPVIQISESAQSNQQRSNAKNGTDHRQGWQLEDTKQRELFSDNIK